MAEEAFALSPISASAAVPTDADYHAIREAFMETARGRWFLNEYAKRNRNADTAMVLEAVARIEQNLGAAHHEAAAPQPPEGLPETMQAALEKAREAIRHEFSETGFDPALMPWRKSARIIREIVWGLRESGADPRICNILDGQVRAIEAACDEFPLADIRDRILAALDAAASQDQEEVAPATAVEASGTEQASATYAVAEVAAAVVPVQSIEPQPEPVVAEAAETPVLEALTVEAPPAETAIAAAPVVETAAVEVAETATVEVAVVEPVVAETEAAAATPADIPAPITISPEAVALEAALLTEDIAEPAPIAAASETPQPAPTPAAPRSIMTASAAQPAPQPMAEHIAGEVPVEVMATDHPNIEAAPEGAAPVTIANGGNSEDDLWADIAGEIAPLPPLDPVHEASLGASLIAQGVVARPSNARPDLLAPIRRMSHAERIAFFS